MKFLCVASLLFAGLLFTARAQQEADERYVGVYGLLQQADTLADTGDPGEAVAAYADVQSQLQRFQKQFPTWNPNIVSFRLNQVAGKLADLKSRPGFTAKKIPKLATPAVVVPPPAANDQPTDELANLRTQLQTAQAANEILQAKVKEALAIQPAAVDPRELAKAQEKIRSLMKEIDLANAVRRPVEPATTATQFVTNVVTVFVTNATAVEVTNLTAVFEKNPAPLVVTNIIRVLVTDTNALEMARLDYLAAVKNFNEEHSRAEQLDTRLQQLLRNASAGTPPATPVTPANPVVNSAADATAALAGLRAENARLQNELALLRHAPANPTPAVPPSTDLKQAQALIASLQSEAEIATLEKMALQNKLQRVLAATNAGVNVADYEARIRDLTQERNTLIEKLDLAKKAGSGNKNTTEQISALNDEVRVLRSRLVVAEAAPVPYTVEEQSLFKAPAVKLANPEAVKKPISEMPAGSMELVASAQSHFARQEYDAAEADYQKILEHDQNNGIALANLATIELQAGKLADAEKHITAALVQSPDDAYNLSTLGYLKFRQDKYDEALNALSRAAQIDPNNPEIQNYLGVTLSHKGQRKEAETALRRALQLNPNYAPAHNNLAVVYLGQNPPLAELARWHYQKAIDAGQPRNPDLEKILADKGAPVAP